MSGLDKVLISDMMGGFVSEAPPTPFVSYCVVCNVFLTQDEMVYQKGHVFHKDCFDEHGKDYPDVNHALNSINTNAKVLLVKLKNLKVRQHGGLKQSISGPKRKVKTKRKSKTKKPKRKTIKKKSAASKRNKTKKRSNKRRSPSKRRSVSKKRRSSKKKTRRRR